VFTRLAFAAIAVNCVSKAGAQSQLSPTSAVERTQTTQPIDSGQRHSSPAPSRQIQPRPEHLSAADSTERRLPEEEAQSVQLARWNSWVDAAAFVIAAISAGISMASLLAARSARAAAAEANTIAWQNRRDTYRPEVRIASWVVDSETLSISEIHNHGRGPALSFGLFVEFPGGAREPAGAPLEMIVKDIPGGPKHEQLEDFKIPLRRSAKTFSIHMFWTDIHDNKHWVELGLYVDFERSPDSAPLGARWDEGAFGERPEIQHLHEIAGSIDTPRIYIYAREAKDFPSGRGFRERIAEVLERGSDAPRDDV
jgi:hypothetical protein